MLTIKKMLGLYRLDVTNKIKIARHQDTRDVNVHELFYNNEFELYQSYQETDKFKGCKYLVSCLGINNNQALFVGVYEIKNTYNVDGFPSANKFPPGKDVSFRGKAKLKSRYKYDLEKLTGFEDLERRLVISWSGVAQGWCVWLDTYPNEVVQLLPKGFVKDFPGYYDINLTFKELKEIIRDPDVNRTWYKSLSSVGGVYLILDTTDGMQYVGSASGKEGLYGRWKKYVENGHGNNKKLKEVLEKEPERIYKFKYTILQTLPAALTSTEAIREENKYKEKLGTRAFGLNSN
ncbi:GIY-YIG nuclease family protein [Bacillus sp. FJAT-52991]|uniref:GIY-YIG nuclease family protein n=1 Tax=Bacillus kandeliae TaxID=3129297 RepID=A0ABZ2N3R0_9BACI